MPRPSPGVVAAVRGRLDRGAGPNAVWVVGRNTRRGGVILHWDGEEWLEEDPGGSESLSRVWGSGPDDIWTIGEDTHAGGLRHFDGEVWTGSPARSSWR